MTRNFKAIVLLGLWLSGCAICIGVLMVYSNTPGQQGEVAQILAPDSEIQLDTQRPTLVMYAHPHCPCTEASVEELTRLQARLKGKFLTCVVFYVPEDGINEESWREDGMWDDVQRLTDTVVLADPGGKLAKQAGAEISGTVGLYAPDRRLLYFGGITPARGHAGDNVGTFAIQDYFNELAFDGRGAAYGCQIADEISVYDGGGL